MTVTASLSPVVKYHGFARRHLMPSGFLMRSLLNGGTGRATVKDVENAHESRTSALLATGSVLRSLP